MRDDHDTDVPVLRNEVRATLRAEVLLGLKKIGFGTGRIVGLGGHVEPGETAAEAAVREVAEESGVRVEVEDLRVGGTVTFRFPARPKWNQIVSVFVADRFSGRPEESDEIVPQWFEVDDLPFTKMWDDARLWLTRVLAGEQISMEIIFADDCETVSDARFSAVA